MGTDTTKPNFFILLGLNPDEFWDQAKFERVLREKRTQWSLDSSGVAKKAIAAKKNLELIPEIKQVMDDPAQRGAQAAAARAELASGNQEKIKKFEAQLKLAEAKGYLEESELKAFISEFKDALSEKDIRSRIKVPIRAHTAQTVPVAEQLAPSLAKEIAEKLEFLHLLSLYELLDRPQMTSSQELCRIAEQLYNDMLSRQPKTAEVTLKSDLAGHAKVIFKSEKMRKKYDESRRQSSLNTLLKALDESLSRTTEKELHEKQVGSFLQAARKAGWQEEVALARLKEHARQRKWFLRIPTTDDSAQQQRCGYCNEMNEKGRNFCRSCNRELSSQCPSCGQAVGSDEVGCGHCGFPVGNRYWVDDALQTCDYLLNRRDLKGLQTQLVELEGAWNPSKPDARIQKIHTYKDQLQRLVQDQRRIAEQLRHLMEQRQFYTARQLLTSQVGTLSDPESYRRTIEAGITQGQDLLKRAQSRTIGQEERMDLCRQALRVCADYKEARDLLSTMPPSPPRDLQAKVGGMVVSLAWDLSTTPGVAYKIVRKARSQPVSPQDGVVLGTAAGRIYADTQPEIGLPLYYAVFAMYEEVPSAQGATLQQPVLLVQDLTNVTVQVNDRLVELSWQTPSNVQSRIVVRKEQTAPRSMEDGVRLSTLDPRRLVDRDVQNEHTYYYAIYSQFRDQNNRLVTSPGVVVSARPETPPEVITHLDITHTKLAQGYAVQLSWTAPSKGKIAVLRSEKPVSLKAGEVIPVDELKRYGRLLEGYQETLRDNWSGPGIVYYTPIVLFGGMAYIGASRRYVCMDDVDDLKYQNLGTALRLRWDWPANCQEALVSYSYAGWPQPNEATTITRKVTRAEYEFLGHFDIRGTLNQDYYILVSAVVKQGNDQVITPGASIHARLASKITLMYEIRQARFGRKQRMLLLSARTPGTVPTLLLVCKRNGLPFKKTEGELFHRVEGPFKIEKELTIALPDKAVSANTFGKLFLDDDNLYDVVSVHHPSEDKLRLS